MNWRSLDAKAVLIWAVGAMLTLCWLLGGVTQDSTSADEILQLMALPVLMLGGYCLEFKTRQGVVLLGIAAAIAVVLLPALQLLPLPAFLSTSDAASGIRADLTSAGIAATSWHASVSPFATERGLWSLLPALAVFTGALALPVRQLRTMVVMVLSLALASALFAFFQLSLPDGSSLLLYTEWGRNFGGLFANPNHQGSALSIGAVIAAALFIDGRRRAREGAPGHRYWLYAFLCVASVLMVPLANGSAAMLLVMAGLLVVGGMLAAQDWKFIRRGRASRLWLAAATGLLLVLVASGAALRNSEEGRRLMAATTISIGHQFAPWGAGISNFVPVYGQYQNLDVARSELINHAHNEYAQWWLEGGVLAVLEILGGLCLFAWLGWQVLARMSSRRLRSVAAPAWTCLLVLCMHSMVDFPLRTTALMATAALFVGLLLNAVSASWQERQSRTDRDVASQRA